MQLKNLLLKTAMDLVPTHGWTSRSIREAAKSLSAPTVTSGLFPLKGMELIDHYSRQVEQECRDRTELNSPDFYVNVAALLKERLHALEPKKELWKLALEEMSKAQNLRFGVDNLLKSADEFCYLAGDRSFDVIIIMASYLYLLVYISCKKSCDCWCDFQHRLILC
jgi:rpsU-divergently transcribed protein